MTLKIHPINYGNTTMDSSGLVLFRNPTAGGQLDLRGSAADHEAFEEIGAIGSREEHRECAYVGPDAVHPGNPEFPGGPRDKSSHPRR